MNLAEFLLARIDKDEAVARAAIANGEGALDWADAGDPTDVHIARWDPARVIAECDAKRRIVELYRDAERAVATYDHAHPTDAYWQEWGNWHALEPTVELLALPHADHPDYDESWRP